MYDWTDADDEQPADDREVLITGYRDKTTERYIAVAYYDEEREAFMDAIDDEVWEYIGVTHWQELPEFPE
jgi:Protein of unknown function (DUF551)